MVSETAAEILGVNADSASPDDVARAFWLRAERVDARIVATENEALLRQLLEEKEKLLEARALLEGISVVEIQRQLVERKSAVATPARSKLLLIAAISWVVAAAGLLIAYLFTRPH